ncbi:ubiquitin conjugation factor E4 A [Lingula anatina]|uniref:Ubiquitin conjugation factor E4 A n=1 Tax=Lingula anatina TaxID=7574 RepID=A0A1S3IKK3_LINAN|nr:ubiquitin conjugation factor E4 A [Lingula anatina]|eukprot:XP_013398421.1 ubiquitin conjugation factor E4 A [Lingula anatina]
MSRMSGPDLKNNPFTALFPSVLDAQQFAAGVKDALATSDQDISESIFSDQGKAEEVVHLNNLIERIFLITLDQTCTSDKFRPAKAVFMAEFQLTLGGQDWLDLEILETCLFERLVFEEPDKHIVKTSKTGEPDRTVTEGRVLFYLYYAYVRAVQETKKIEDESYLSFVTVIKDIIIRNGKTSLQTAPLFVGQDPGQQFLDIFMEEHRNSDSEIMMEFLELVASEIDSHQEDGSLAQILRPVLDQVTTTFHKELGLNNPRTFDFVEFVLFMTRTECLGKVFMDYTTPRDIKTAKNFEMSLLGCTLSISCIPENPQGPFQFFTEPSTMRPSEVEMTMHSLWQPIAILNEKVHKMIYNLLKLSEELKHRTLEWLGNCLTANQGRAKLWSNHLPPELLNRMYCSDGFFINLCAVLLRLCKPFCAAQSPKLLKIQLSYCAVEMKTVEEGRERNMHLKGLNKETSLIPPPEGSVPYPGEDKFNFLTECFMMTHYCLHLGIHVIHEKFMRLNQEMGQLEGAYRDLVNSGAEGSAIGRQLKDRFEKRMSMFQCVRAALLEPQIVQMSLQLHVASATLLVNLAAGGVESFLQEICFPLPDPVPDVLTVVPEFLVENMVDLVVFIRRFRDETFEIIGGDISHFASLILVFMGSPQRMKNPHLRAKLAQTLENLMPVQNEMKAGLIANYHREQLFVKHPLIQHLAETLLHVFVSIEMTGQAVQFEQKFNYRRPMYKILDYIWNIEIHHEALKRLSAHAEEHIEDSDAPLFLRFINLLVNDATFLLDEALMYMSQIKEQQEEKDSGAWQNLPEDQQREKESNLQQLTMLSRFHNLMSRDTIHILELLTRDIQTLFIHNIMVDRIAAMLNYFLIHLVGPKKKNLKVKNFEEFEFKPQLIVSDICQIYLNLGSHEAFCLAVTADGRSYSPDLLPQAERVLQRIGKPVQMISEFAGLAEEIKSVASQQKEEEELLGDVPEEFQDAIMGTVMKDPVILPSGQVVDRSTIARHLLSDQTDPFNRSPLTMEMLKPHDELREKIKLWIQDNKK